MTPAFCASLLMIELNFSLMNFFIKAGSEDFQTYRFSSFIIMKVA